MEESSSSLSPLAKNHQAAVFVKLLQELHIDQTELRRRVAAVSKLYHWSKRDDALCWEILSRPALTAQQLYVATAIVVGVHLPVYVYRKFLFS